MINFTPAFLDQIRRRLSLADLIGRYTTIQKKGATLQACCPFHNEKTPSFYIYEDDGHYHCYGCKVHGDAFDFLMEKKGYTFFEAVEELAGQAGLSMPKPDEQSGGTQGLPREVRELYSEIMESAAKFYEKKLLDNSGAAAKRYIDGRGIRADVQKFYRLGYAPRGSLLANHLLEKGYALEALKTLGLVKESREKPGEVYDNFRDRLMFPICDHRGKVIAFGGRILGPGEPKYLNSPETPLYHKGNVVYGYHLARPAAVAGEPVLCCEGYLDVIALHQGGFQAAVAPLGTAITDQQIRLLWRLSPEPLMCLDGDTAGQKAALRALETALPLLQTGHSLRFVSLPQGEDPDSLLQKGQHTHLRELIKNASPMIDHLWAAFIRGVTLETPEQKAALRQRIFDYLKRIRDSTIRKSYEFDLNDRMRAHMREISDAQYQQRQGSFQKEGGRGQGRARSAGGASKATQATINVEGMQGRIMLACLLNHPQILREVESDFMEVLLSDPALARVREEMIQYLFDGGTLDKESLNNHLYERGLKDTVDSICSVATYTHGRFSMPTENPEVVLEQWRRLWTFCQGKSALEQELQAARVVLESNPTTEAFTRLQKLQQELALLKN